MSKPLPYIYLPKLSDQKRLIYALWDIGYKRSRSNRNAEECFKIWVDDADDAINDIASTPYMYLGLLSKITPTYNYYAAKTTDEIYKSICPYRVLVNSIPHFVSYTRRNFPAQSD